MTTLKRSHALEAATPGTVDLRAADGDDLALGQALYPVPADDPLDPLQWPAWKKSMILVVCVLFSFLSNASLLGPSVYISIYADEFGVTATKASGLISYPNIVYGCSVIVTVPAYRKFGRRPVILLAILGYLGGLLGASYCSTFETLMSTRVIQTIFSGVCEALPVQLINDIFFLHERGAKLGIYTIALCLGATAPLPAGYMLRAGHGWRLFFSIMSAFAGVLFIMAFLFVEETMYERVQEDSGPTTISTQSSGIKDGTTERREMLIIPPPRRTFLASLKPWSGINRDEQILRMIFGALLNFSKPAALWVILSYGIYIGLGALVFNYTFPIKITQPPYSWSSENSGLISIGNIIGYGLAIPLVWTSDWLAALLTRRNGGIREAEHRLGVLIPAMFIAPAGLIVYGVTAELNLHFVGFFAGVAMCDWASYFYFTVTLAYAIDSHSSETSEMLIATCVGKQLISFAFGLYLLDWVEASGYAVIIGGVFGAVVLANNVLVLLFLRFGKTIRMFYASSRLAKMNH